MKITVNDRHFNCATVPINISFQRWLYLKLFGHIKVFRAKKGGYTAEIDFYIARCESCHKYFLDHPHGAGRQRLDCPVCE